jgi:hypothetical protein
MIAWKRRVAIQQLDILADEVRDVQEQLREVELPGGEDDGSSDPPTTPDGFVARAIERLQGIVGDLESARRLSLIEEMGR